jgi:hypothetical protein
MFDYRKWAHDQADTVIREMRGCGGGRYPDMQLWLIPGSAGKAGEIRIARGLDRPEGSIGPLVLMAHGVNVMVVPYSAIPHVIYHVCRDQPVLPR